jgi:nucleoside-diphosphate-sugar epimerase
MREPTGGFWQGRSVVATGGAGFVGIAVVRELEAI